MIRSVLALFAAVCLWLTIACSSSAGSTTSAYSSTADGKTIEEWAKSPDKAWLPKNSNNVLPADEIAQRTYERVMQYRGVEAKVSKGYMRRAARSVVTDEWRSQQVQAKHRQSVMNTEVVAKSMSSDGQVASVDRVKVTRAFAKLLDRAVGGLKLHPHQRAVQMLGEGKSLATISRRLQAAGADAGKRTVKRWFQKTIPEALRRQGLEIEAEFVEELYDAAKPKRGRKPSSNDSTADAQTVYQRGYAFLSDWLTRGGGCMPWPDCRGQGPTAVAEARPTPVSRPKTSEMPRMIEERKLLVLGQYHHSQLFMVDQDSAYERTSEQDSRFRPRSWNAYQWAVPYMTRGSTIWRAAPVVPRMPRPPALQTSGGRLVPRTRPVALRAPI